MKCSHSLFIWKKKPPRWKIGGSGRPGFDRVRRICRVTAKGHRYKYADSSVAVRAREVRFDGYQWNSGTNSRARGAWWQFSYRQVKKTRIRKAQNDASDE
jgi:hypothetical protein